MFKHILLAIDGSQASDKAVQSALKLAKLTGAKLLAVTATEIWSALEVSGPDGRGRIQKFEAAQKVAADKIIAAFLAVAKDAGIESRTVHVPDQDAASAIVDTAKREGCDVIVMGSHGRRGLDRLLVGSQAQRVLTHATCPVLVCR